MNRLTPVFAQQRQTIAKWPRRQVAAAYVFIALSVIAICTNDAAAQSRKRVTSNADFLLDATLLDASTGDNVELFGLIHVQTQVETSRSNVTIHANIREDQFFAYAINDQAPSNPLLEELSILKELVRDLKNQLAALEQQILDLQRQLQEVKQTDSEPLIPGHQTDKQRLRELQARLAQLSAELHRVRQALSEAMNEIESILEEIQRQQEEEGDVITAYKALGADAVGPVPCSLDLLCEEVVAFDLIRSNGDAAVFEVRLRLGFTELAKISTGDASLEHESTDPDDGGGGDDTPLCP